MTATVTDLVNDVRAALGDGLVAAVVYGSAARAEPQSTAVDVMLLVRDAGADVLRRLGPAVGRWADANNPPPLLLTLAEWTRRSDVFAMEYADVLERHRVVHGTLPVDGVTVKPADLRTQLESEITGKLLRFRRGVMRAGADVDRTRALLDESLPTMLALLRATLHLHGEAAPDSADAVCDRAGELAGFDAAVFRAVVAQRRNGTPIAPGDVSHVVTGYLAALDALLHHVDGFAVSERPLRFPLSPEAS